jgi:hypothetical protein
MVVLLDERREDGNALHMIARLDGGAGSDVLGLLRERWPGSAAYKLGAALRDSGVDYTFWSRS